MLRPVKKEIPLERPVNKDLEFEVISMPHALEMAGLREESEMVLKEILTLEPGTFFAYEHNVILSAYKKLHEKDKPITASLLHQAILDAGEWRNDDEKGIGNGFLMAMLEKAGFVAELPFLLYELKKLKHKRDMIYTAENFQSRIQNWREWNTADVYEALNELNRAFKSSPGDIEDIHDFKSLLQRDIQTIRDHISGGTKKDSFPSGFSDIDAMTGELIKGNLNIVCARTSMGKTSFGLDVAKNVSCLEGRPTVVFSLEMTQTEILRRLVSKISKIGVKELRQSTLQKWDLEEYEKTIRDLEDSPIFIYDRNMTPLEIEREIHNLNRKIHPKEIELVIIDHLQLVGVRDRTKYERRDRQLAAYTSTFKDMAKSNDCVFIVLSQLNRNVDHRPIGERMPRLSDLRESGAIEQDADVVMALYRKQVDNAGADPSSAELAVLKNRHGPCGNLPLRWDRRLASFNDYMGA